MTSISRFILVWVFLVASSFVRAEDTKRFPEVEWASWLQVEYPTRFEMDPKSLQGEEKWWAKFKDPSSGLSFEVVAFGFISEFELLKTVPGYTAENVSDKLREDERETEEIIAKDAAVKNAGEYFRAYILPDGAEESAFPGYERFIAKEKKSVSVYFLSKEAYKENFGRCYQLLKFNFPEGEYEKHRGVIDAIIAKAKPPY